MIPKIIHSIAPADESKWHVIWRKCYDSWFKQFDSREFKFIMWDDNLSLKNFVAKNYPQYLDFYNNLPHKIMKIDIARLLILHKYGGIYHDMDVFCYRNFYSYLLRKKSKLFLVQAHIFPLDKRGIRIVTPGEYIQNNLLATKKENEFFLSCVEFSKSLFSTVRNFPFNKNSNKSFESISSTIFFTGPTLIQNTLSYVYNCFEKNQFDKPWEVGLLTNYEVNLLPHNLFNPSLTEYREIFYTKHFFSNYWVVPEPTDKIIKNNLHLEKFHINIKAEDYDFYKNYKVKD